MKKQTKNEIGITLVALVITIIILLILAGITIGVFMQTELLNKAKQSKIITQNAIDLENNTLNEYENKINQISSSREIEQGGTSTLISKIEIEVKEVTMNSISIKINLLENETMYAGVYFAILNGKVITGGKENEIEINNLEKSKEYKIQGGVLDVDAKIKISDIIKQSTESGKYLYNKGNQYIKDTGGWSIASEGNVKMDITSYDYMTAMATSGGSCMSYIMTKNTIDISNYSKLYAEVYTIGGHYENSGRYPATFGISTVKGYYLKYLNQWKKYEGLIYDNTTRRYEIDISEITGNFYIGFSQYLNSKIYKIWLE